MHYKLFIATAALAALLPMPSERADSRCFSQEFTPSGLAGGYPLHELSPIQSLNRHDLVFLGEVVVPTRPCSLGYCAGLRVVKGVKGKAHRTLLVSVKGDAAPGCAPPLFRDRGTHWLVFGHDGTSPGGTGYVEVDTIGPTYPSRTIPDFHVMERSYAGYKARLDDAINSRIGKRTQLR